MTIAALPFIGGPEVEDVPWPRPTLTLVKPSYQHQPSTLALPRSLAAAPLRRRGQTSERPSSTDFRRRRIVLSLVGLIVVVGLCLPLKALGTVTVSGQATPGGAPAGLADGSIYVVQRGDSLASIAQRINPARQTQLVEQMIKELGSSTVVAGEHLVLP
jgi:hypothetical protein